ncbi:hypothetical protein U1Q18_037559 [Sarracenia purpurea var. burkii]
MKYGERMFGYVVDRQVVMKSVRASTASDGERHTKREIGAAVIVAVAEIGVAVVIERGLRISEEEHGRRASDSQ